MGNYKQTVGNKFIFKYPRKNKYISNLNNKIKFLKKFYIFLVFKKSDTI